VRAQDVADKRFQPTKFREGYDQGDVDAFLDRVQAALTAAEQGRPVGLTPEEVVETRFRPTRFRDGYDQDQVDDFLDDIVAALRPLQRP